MKNMNFLNTCIYQNVKVDLYILSAVQYLHHYNVIVENKNSKLNLHIFKVNILGFPLLFCVYKGDG